MVVWLVRIFLKNVIQCGKIYQQVNQEDGYQENEEEYEEDGEGGVGQCVGFVVKVGFIEG